VRGRVKDEYRVIGRGGVGGERERERGKKKHTEGSVYRIE